MPLICLRRVHYQKKNGKFAQKAKFVEYYSVDWTNIVNFLKKFKNKGLSEIMVEMCSKYQKSGNIMVQNWEENLDFFKKIKTALLSFSIYSKKYPNFRSIGFKCPVLIFVDLIFFGKKGSYCGLYRFWGKKLKNVHF